MRPIERLDVDITTCSYCGWRYDGDSVAVWRQHMQAEHPSAYQLQLRIVDAIKDTGQWDTSYEAACLRLAYMVQLGLTAERDEPDEHAEPCDCRGRAWCHGGQMWGRWVPAATCRQYTIGFGDG